MSPKKNDVAAGYDHRESDVPSHRVNDTTPQIERMTIPHLVAPFVTHNVVCNHKRITPRRFSSAMKCYSLASSLWAA